MTVENWRPVPGYEGIYEVSDRGNVRSLPRVVVGTRDTRRYPGVPLKAKLTHGYRTVTLCRNGRCRATRVHHLVLLAFVGPRPTGAHGLHGDDNRLNNSPDNLRWGTQKENVADAVRNKRLWMQNRDTCRRGHPLAEPNLVAAGTKRNCLACNRAHAATYTAKFDSDHREALVAERADQNFAEIMAGRPRGARRAQPSAAMARDLADAGFSAQAIATRFGCHPATVRRRLRERTAQS